MTHRLRDIETFLGTWLSKTHKIPDFVAYFIPKNSQYLENGESYKKVSRIKKM